MVAARTRLEIATENLANVSSDGFERIVARGSLTAHGVAIARERLPHGAPRVFGDAGSHELPGARAGNGVEAISEMVDVLAAERSFESAEKAVSAIDRAREKAAEAARIQA